MVQTIWKTILLEASFFGFQTKSVLPLVCKDILATEVSSVDACELMSFFNDGKCWMLIMLWSVKVWPCTWHCFNTLFSTDDSSKTIPTIFFMLLAWDDHSVINIPSPLEKNLSSGCGDNG